MPETYEHIFITGVSSGIGHALARVCLDRDGWVYGVSRRTPEDLVENEAFQFLSADLGDLNSVDEVIERLLDGVPKLDLVVLNAGVLGRLADVRESSLAELQHSMDVNLWANKVILDTVFGLGVPVRQVIGISSGAAVNGHRGWGGYALSKAALNMLIQLYAAELPDTHFCAFAPGLVDTRMQEYLCREVHDERFASVERLRAARGTERMPSPEQIAPRLLEAFAQVRETAPSGAFVDIREM